MKKPVERFLEQLDKSVSSGTLSKLTLGKPVGPDHSLRNIFIRPVMLKAGPRFSIVWRHATQDVTKNYEGAQMRAFVGEQLGSTFMDAHLFSGEKTVHLELGRDGGRIRTLASRSKPEGLAIEATAKAGASPAPWLKELGITDAAGKPLAGMADKLRQIERFTELLEHRLAEIKFPSRHKIRIFDMGCGKGYLTFATSDLLGETAEVFGVEQRPELVAHCAGAAAASGLASRLTFKAGTIATTDVAGADVLIALHACDTATDDAIAKGVAAGAALIIVAPCCHKEVRRQLRAPQVLESALGHGILAERQAEFATDALRAELLEWAGYKTRVFEFISTEHTAKNTMIAATRTGSGRRESLAGGIRDLARFYGIKRQALATQLGFEL